MRSRRVSKSGKTQIITLTADEKAAWKKALVPVHREMESRDRQGHHPGGLQGNRLQALAAHAAMIATPLRELRLAVAFSHSGA